jgi:hypothetical protein
MPTDSTTGLLTALEQREVFPLTAKYVLFTIWNRPLNDWRQLSVKILIWQQFIKFWGFNEFRIVNNSGRYS